MKIISCASYYGSGSSAVTDLLSEYDSIYSLTNTEFRFAHDPNGISDLEYNLVQNFNRNNSGRALKLYKKLVDFNSGNFVSKRYEKYFNGNWKKVSYEYIRELTDFKYKGAWMYDVLDRGSFVYYFSAFLNKILRLTIWHNQPERFFNILKNEETYCSNPSEERFLLLTKKYTSNLFNSLNTQNKMLMVDQLVPSTNISRYLRYFDDVQVVLVDRDPRDIYVLEKYVWKDDFIPTTPELFCKWFKYTRNNRSMELKNKKRVKFIQFEDLIFNYDTTVASIERWLGLNKQLHINEMSYFDPKKSVKNTKTWKKINCNLDEIKYIEKNLENYLYNFD